MSARLPGRRTESLFDNRYRYDQIYPRGRSGETLRAYDTQANDRPVVIKRPAPQDAPPMRAGQEVSIRTERQALERLSGHAVLTELRGSGSFRVGGHTHDYIVMDLATGEIVENMVLALAGHNATLPELETLVIVDRLLDLLAYAHEKQVIYNDVDAKHLFWDREQYRLKVIDWGNAVFLDEPGALPTVSRATDVYQCGELLYFILTGGSRLATEVIEGGEAFYVNFGPNAENISPRLQAIVTRAVHPDAKRRYGTINELRQALAEYRQPLEKNRDEIVSRVRKRVRSTASQEELAELAAALQVALDMDPGYPNATALGDEIRFHLSQIALQADLDAIRIYLETANWPRALSLLHDLLPDAGEANEPLLRFLIEGTALLDSLHIAPPPAGFIGALDELFAGQVQAAGQVLLTTPESRPAARRAQWLLGECLAVLVPDVVLLRPHLVRLRHALDGRPEADRALARLDAVEEQIEAQPLPGLTGLQIVYQQTIAALGQLEEAVDALPDDGGESGQPAALASVIRARRAAHDLVDLLGEVGQYVFGDPSRAGELLYQASLIDPTSPHFAALSSYFDEVHQAVAALGQFKPKDNGVNLADWFADVQDFLDPYLRDLPDPRLEAAAHALHRAGEGWARTISYLALGRRQPTIEVLRDTAEIIRPFNEQLAAWLGTLANRIPDAAYVEHHSPNTRLGDLLVEGWKAWDRGDFIRAIDIGQQAYEAAQTDGERLAAERLRRLSELADHWLAADGMQSLDITDQVETEVLTVLLSEEEQERRTFAEQMPNTALYLRAMSRGIVAYIRQSSSAGWRALYTHYTLRGMLALLGGDLNDAEFWRDVAAKTYDDARLHRLFQVLDRTLTGRRLVQTAQKVLNDVSGPGDLEEARRALNAPLAEDWLVGTGPALNAVTEAVRDWSDGDFHAARQQLDAALEHIQMAIERAGLDVDRFVAWLTELRDSAAELQQARLSVEQAALAPRSEVDPAVGETLRRIVRVTLDHLGPDYAHQVRQWEDMYWAVLETYTSARLTRREKLAAFGRHFTSLFITKHPAYPLFRHWESVIEAQPPDEIEPVGIAPEPEADSYQTLPVEGQTLAFLEDDREPEPVELESEAPTSELPWNRIILAAVAVLIVAAVFAIIRYAGRDDEPGIQPDSAPTEIVGAVLPPPSATPEPTAEPSNTPAPAIGAGVETAAPLPTTEPPSATPEPPTPTLLPPPSATPEPTAEPTLDPTTPPATEALASVSSPDLPVTGGTLDVLESLAVLPADQRVWPTGAFDARVEGDGWLLSTANSGGGVLQIELTPDLLAALFQPGVANALNRADVVLELVAWDDTALANDEVAFGLGAINRSGQTAVGQVRFDESNLINLGLSQNDRFYLRSVMPQQDAEIELSMRRVDENTLGFFVDGKHLGDPVILFPNSEPITLVLYASGQGVQVKVSAFSVTIRPRSELP